MWILIVHINVNIVYLKNDYRNGLFYILIYIEIKNNKMLF